MFVALEREASDASFFELIADDAHDRALGDPGAFGVRPHLADPLLEFPMQPVRVDERPLALFAHAQTTKRIG